MAAPSVTYQFLNGTTSDGPQVSTNFSDLISAMSDGTKDFTINALTLNGTGTFKGNILPQADATYDIGSSSFRFLNMYLSGAATVAGNVTITGEFAGSRVVVRLGGVANTSLTSDGYFSLDGTTPSSTAIWNYVAPRAGSIVGYSVGVNCYSRTNSHVFKVDIRKNEASVITGGTITTSATGFFSDRATAARGTYTFSAGDRIEAFYDYTSGSASNGLGITVLAELQFDT